MNIHMHSAPVKSPCFGEGSGAPRCVPHSRQAWHKGEVLIPHPQVPAFAGSSSCQAVKRDIIKTTLELFQHKTLSPLQPLSHCFLGPLQLQQHHWSCVWGWAASACSGQQQSQITRESCQQGRESANSQTIFLMIFLMPWKEDEGFKPTMKHSLFNLEQCSNAWHAKAPGGQAQTAPFWWVQNDFLTPSDRQSNCSSSPADAISEFAVLPFQEPLGSNINGDLLWEEDASCNKGLINLQWGHAHEPLWDTGNLSLQN